MEKGLLVALSPLRRVLRILRRLYIRSDVCHGETLILFTGTLGTLPEILFGPVKGHFPPAVDADILPWTDLLSGLCCVSQFDHQREIWSGKLYITFDSSQITPQNRKKTHNTRDHVRRVAKKLYPLLNELMIHGCHGHCTSGQPSARGKYRKTAR